MNATLVNSAGHRDGVPAWMHHTVVTANLAVIAFGLSGLGAAVVGAFEPEVVGPVGAVAFVALAAFTRGLSVSNPRVAVSRAAHVAAAGVVVFVAASSVYSVRHGAEHVEINRDPGFYVNAAKWLERDGSLVVDANRGPFAAVSSLGYTAPGLPEPSPGQLQFQGDHLLPVLMAEAAWIGGDDALFAMPILLGALALLTVFALLASRTSAWPAAAATVALGASVLWIAFSRDAYTEIPSLAMVAFALYLLPARGVAPGPAAARVIGLALGALGALRIDAPLLWMLWPLIVGGWWMLPGLADGSESRRDAARATVALLVGFAIAAGIGVVDLLVRSSEYASDLAGRTTALWAAFAGVAAGTAVVVAVPAIRHAADRLRARLAGSRLAGVGAAVAVVVGALALWIVRPRLGPVRGVSQQSVGYLQQAAGIPVDATRKYSEYSFAWQAWYLGPVLVLLAIAGLAWAVATPSIRRRWMPLLLTTAPASVLYLYRPNIFPDHTWVMRRFITTLTFALVAGAAIALHVLLRAGTRRAGRMGMLVALAAALAMIAIPAWWTRPVRGAADQRGYLAAIEDACTRLGPDAAVIVLKNEQDVLYKKIPQALRGWCGVPVAIAGASFTPSVQRELTAQWRERGIDLWIVAADPFDIAKKFCPGPELPADHENQPYFAAEFVSIARVEAENRFLLEQTLTRRPRGYSVQSLTFFMLRTRDCEG